MESKINLCKNINLRKPISIQGVTGIGFISKIVATHIMQSLVTEKFIEISSPFFEDIAISTSDGGIKFPLIEFYYSRTVSLNDLIILRGNTQALTSYGQYELCSKILDVIQKMGCQLVVCIDGLGKNAIAGEPKVYFTATDFETLDRLMKYDLSIFQGRISGISGLLIGLAKLRGMKGICLLAETAGINPDVVAAKAILDRLNSFLGLKIDLVNLEKAVENINDP
ncbi:MAG: PAC2 family protein [Candidatus Bathyarchaeota archaeon]